MLFSHTALRTAWQEYKKRFPQVVTIPNYQKGFGPLMDKAVEAVGHTAAAYERFAKASEDYITALKAEAKLDGDLHATYAQNDQIITQNGLHGTTIPNSRVMLTEWQKFLQTHKLGQVQAHGTWVAGLANDVRTYVGHVDPRK